MTIDLWQPWSQASYTPKSWHFFLMSRPETGSPRSLAGPSKIVEFEPPGTDSNRQNFFETKRQAYFNSNFATTVSFDNLTATTQDEDGARVFKGTNITVSTVGFF